MSAAAELSSSVVRPDLSVYCSGSTDSQLEIKMNTKMVTASGGYDLPAWEKLTTLKTWAEEGPPKGTLYHYPNPHNHQVLSISCAPAPPKIAAQIYTQAIATKLVAKYTQGGDSIDKAIGWASSELEGFMRA